MTVAQDASSSTVATSSSSATDNITSASITPAGPSLLVAEWNWNTGSGDTPAAPGILDSLASHLTWTLREHHVRGDTTPNVDGQCAVWTAPVVTGLAMTVTVTAGTGTTSHGGSLLIRVITGGDSTTPVGAHGEWSQNSGTTIARTPTATATGSLFLFCACDWDLKGAETAGTGCTLTGGGSGSAGTEISYLHARRTSADGTAGVATALNATLPTASTALSGIYLEVVPPGGSNATATPSVVVATVGIGAPTVQTGSTVAPPAVATSVGIGAPTIKTASLVTAPAVAVSVGIGAPTVQTSELVTAPAVGAVVGVGTATIKTASLVTAPAVGAVVGIGTPGVTAGGSASVMPGAVPVAVGIGTPAVSAASNATASPPAVAVAVGVGAPTVGAGSTITLASVRAAVGIGVPLVVVPGTGGVTGNLRSSSPVVSPGAVVAPPLVAVGGGIT